MLDFMDDISPTFEEAAYWRDLSALQAVYPDAEEEHYPKCFHSTYLSNFGIRFCFRDKDHKGPHVADYRMGVSEWLGKPDELVFVWFASPVVVFDYRRSGET
jgi:hypothetical protein